MKHQELTIREGRATARLYPIRTLGDPAQCGAQIRPNPSYPDRYTCTRPAGHDGPHVAHTSTTEAAALWTD